jgi:hypothetical protein
MDNQIKCPACKRIISNNLVVESAARGETHAMGSEFVICECGERISFWAVTAQLRGQKTFGMKIKNWFLAIFKGQPA